MAATLLASPLACTAVFFHSAANMQWGPAKPAMIHVVPPHGNAVVEIALRGWGIGCPWAKPLSSPAIIFRKALSSYMIQHWSSNVVKTERILFSGRKYGLCLIASLHIEVKGFYTR